MQLSYSKKRCFFQEKGWSFFPKCSIFNIIPQKRSVLLIYDYSYRKWFVSNHIDTPFVVHQVFSFFKKVLCMLLSSTV